MKLITPIHQARETYVSFLRECLRRARDEYGQVAAEAIVRLAGPPDWTELQRTIRIDILWKEKEEPRAAKVELQGIVAGPAVGAMQVEGMEVLVYPVAWHFCPVRFKHVAADFSPVNEWYRKWLGDSPAAEPGDDGLSGVVHSLSPPMREAQSGGSGWLLLIDFGSAPAGAMGELLRALHEMGATDVRVGASLTWDLKRSSIEALSGELSPETFAETLAEVLRNELDVGVEVAGPMELKVETTPGNSMQANLENLYRMLMRFDPPARANEIGQWIALQRDQLARLAGETPPPELDDLRPMVKDQHFVDAVRQKIGAKATTIWRKLAGDLWVVYVWDQPNGMQFLTTEDPAKHGLSAETLHARAVENYLKARPGIELENAEGVLTARTHDSYDASLLLDDAFWRQVSGRVRGDILACVPTRDVVLISGTGEADGPARLHAMAQRLMERGDHLVSATILRRAGIKWEVFASQPNTPVQPPAAPPNLKTKPWWKFW